MQSLFVIAIILLAAIGDALETWGDFAVFIGLLILLYKGYKYACRKADQWEREREFDERDIY